jgi:hypothetical protein
LSIAISLHQAALGTVERGDEKSTVDPKDTLSRPRHFRRHINDNINDNNDNIALSASLVKQPNLAAAVVIAIAISHEDNTVQYF